MYRGSGSHSAPALLRSYDSRKEPAPEFNCAIWQAGRATCATGLAFKPIQIGQSIFIDEGNGKFNPSPQLLDEACLNEWPGRDVGVFVSIGTGKRPKGTDQQQSQWWESFVGGAMGDFAEAKRRLLSKIEGCEATHQYMMREHLSKRQVNNDNYYRLNVEVGVGEFGMNEWHRLSDISANTRMYLNRSEVQSMNHDASLKMGKNPQRPSCDSIGPATTARVIADATAGRSRSSTNRMRTITNLRLPQTPWPSSFRQTKGPRT